MGCENPTSISERPAGTVAPFWGTLDVILACAKAAPIVAITITVAKTADLSGRSLILVSPRHWAAGRILGPALPVHC